MKRLDCIVFFILAAVAVSATAQEKDVNLCGVKQIAKKTGSGEAFEIDLDDAKDRSASLLKKQKNLDTELKANQLLNAQKRLVKISADDGDIYI